MYENQLTESQQDYLKIISNLITSNHVARVKEIAEQKGVSMPSVTESMKKLAKDKWIFYKSRGYIELTPKGKLAASYFAKRTEFLRNFLHDVLGASDEKAEKEACILEHHLSEKSIKNMGLLYQFLNHCPKMTPNLLEVFSNCINTNDTHDEYFCMLDNYPHFELNQKHILLQNLSENQSAKIMLISPEEDIRNFFLNNGLLPGLEIIMQQIHENSFVILCQDQQIEVPGQYGNKVEVSIIEKEQKP
ncbi:MAG: metal-dependent transcriptional regulator [Candidatus Marinimicrobia bacterium]|nr:metal-dependent transcriptional regulator [Candidatus Neomarinimicrobiota bacterium]